ncbi:MAG TPA: cbb3-type cytochrome c oxidase subunit I [Gemmatimonadales bacterium]|nr:cbb3-type cytochrome c oxidase subunit I [Gemmatimonadales bacterium]
MTTETKVFPQGRLVLANFWVAILAFGVAAAMAMMQAISRANLEVPYRSARMYYMSVTAHGVLMALVFTTFFIMGLGYAVAQKEIGSIRAPRFAWAGFWLGITGLVLAAIPIFTFKASVLYTFYPPLQASPLFYIGLTLVVVASWGWAVEMILSWREARRRNGEAPVSLAMHATTANAILWLFCTLGLAAEMLFLLIPWSLGWTATIDPLLARILFWFTGHPLVYFWILPAYTLWYTVLPREAGGKLFSDPLGRMVFTMFVIISTPVGLHHQFQDPGIPAKWKLLHTMLTMVISFPSLVTAFTICASLEVAGRLRGGQGLFGWIRTLKWSDPAVTSWLVAMLLFLVGGFGGAVNAAYALNSVVHNTAWIQAHFHLTVGSAAALSFMGGMYWLVPKVSGRKLESVPLARVQPWLWFLGMVLFSFSNHIAGLMGVPRRVYATDFGGAEIAHTWKTLTTLSALGGVVLFASAGLFVLVMLSTLLGGQKGEQQPIEWAEPLGGPTPKVGLWDKLGIWFVVAAVLVIIAYGLPLYDHFQLERFGSPGFKPF